MKQATKHDDLIYDVGLHKGEDTDYYLKKGFRVVAFEADPELCNHCRRRFAAEIQSGRLVVVEGAIADRATIATGATGMTFYKNLGNSVWGTVAASWAERNELFGARSSVIEVPVVDFGACLERYGIPHYLKIDIEGMDRVCLETLAEFDSRPDYVSIETEKVSFRRLVGDFDLLDRLGYRSFKVVQQTTIGNQVEPNPAREGHYAGYRFEEGCSGLFGRDLPGKWRRRGFVLTEYRFIFLLYALFGDDGLVRRHLVVKALRKVLLWIVRRPIPGWHDAHAALLPR